MQDGVSVKEGGIRGGKELRGGDWSFYERGERILGELEYWTEWNLQCTGGLLEVLGSEG
jgi:hypothetical protein